MRLLKLILYSILISCVLWGSAIALGPLLISKLVYLYHGNAIKLSRVTVSPKLQLKIGHIQFNEAVFGSSPPVSGSSRSFVLDWAFLISKPFVSMTIGPSELNQVGRFESVSMKIVPLERLSFTELLIDFESENLRLYNDVEIED